MGLFNVFKRKKKTTLNVSAKIEVNNEINPIYLEKLDNGLLPGEVVLMDWLNGRAIDSDPPGYFEYTYGINVKKSTDILKKMGLMENALPKEALVSLKITDLKEILRDNKLKVSGNKQKLIDRITAELTDEQVEKYIKQPPLLISSKGKMMLERYYYIIPAHKYDSKDGVYCVATAIDFIKNHNLKFTPGSRDISWALFQEDYLNNHQNKMYGLARNNVHAMAKQVYRENKLKYALQLYLDVCILDLSGLSNGGKLDGPDLTQLTPGIVFEIKNIMEKENIDKKQLQDIFENSWTNTRQSISFHYLTKEECFKCLEHAFYEDYDYINSVIHSKYNELDKESFENRYNLILPISEKYDFEY